MNSDNEYSYYNEATGYRQNSLFDPYDTNDTNVSPYPSQLGPQPTNYPEQPAINSLYIKSETDDNIAPSPTQDSRIPNDYADMSVLGAVFPFEPVWNRPNERPERTFEDYKASGFALENGSEGLVDSGRYSIDLAAKNSTLPDERGRSAHNIIEQRYRNKINDRFEELLACVPALRAASRRSGLKNDEDETEDLEGLSPARKLNKGTILEKLVEYIEFLKLKNARIMRERERLLQQARLMGLSIDSGDDEREER